MQNMQRDAAVVWALELLEHFTRRLAWVFVA